MNGTEREGEPAGRNGGKDGDGLVFHYDREQRLQRAPESVRRMHEEGYTPNKGFIKGLTANAGLKSIFVTIIILSVTIVALTLFGGQSGRISVGGVEVRVRAFLYGEDVYVSVQFPQSGGFADRASPVSALLSGRDGSGATVTEKELDGVYTGSELVLRGIMPDHETRRVVTVVKLGDSSGNVVVSVDRE